MLKIFLLGPNAKSFGQAQVLIIMRLMYLHLKTGGASVRFSCRCNLLTEGTCKAGPEKLVRTWRKRNVPKLPCTSRPTARVLWQKTGLQVFRAFNALAPKNALSYILQQ